MVPLSESELSMTKSKTKLWNKPTATREGLITIQKEVPKTEIIDLSNAIISPREVPKARKLYNKTTRSQLLRSKFAEVKEKSTSNIFGTQTQKPTGFKDLTLKPSDVITSRFKESSQNPRKADSNLAVLQYFQI